MSGVSGYARPRAGRLRLWCGPSRSSQSPSKAGAGAARAVRVALTMLALSGLVLTGIVGVVSAVSPAPAAAQDSIQSARLGSNPQDLALPEDFIKVLKRADVTRYQQIFRLQESGNWNRADKLINKISNPVLMGYVQFQRYMHPTAYRSSYAELAEWMQRYADHPEADRIYNLAQRKRPDSAASPRSAHRKKWRHARRDRTAFEVHNPARSASQRDAVRDIERQVSSFLRRERPSQSIAYIERPDIRAKLTSVEYNRIRSWIARSYYMEQVDDKALLLAKEVANEARDAVPMADWTAGLAAWRQGYHRLSADHFEAVAKARHLDADSRAAGAYWAARAFLAIREPEQVVPMLRLASDHPDTFYGQLARRQLGKSALPRRRAPLLTPSAFEQLKADKGVSRAVALTQVGRIEDATQELAWAHGRFDAENDYALLGLARALRLAHVEWKVATNSNAEGLEAGLYPVPVYEPDSGWQVDRALIYAMMRRESKFQAHAQSHAGARGLMQIMPATALHISGDSRFRGAGRDALFQPGLNLDLAQNYTNALMGRMDPAGNLMKFLCAYNAGPGNLNRWLSSVKYDGDPLLFVESIPVRETRTYVEHVLASFWIYRSVLGQPTPSLDALAGGDWPVYRSIDAPSQRFASR